MRYQIGLYICILLGLSSYTAVLYSIWPFSSPANNSGTVVNNTNNLDNSNKVYICLTNLKAFDPELYKAFFSVGREHLINQSQSIYNWVINNKFTAAFYGTGSLYCGTQIYLNYLAYKLASPNCWSKWQERKTLEQLYAITQTEFARQLITDIQKHYTTIDNPTDFVTPLTAFMHDTEIEYTQLGHYKKIADLYNKLYLGRICLYSKILLESIQERMQRLAFMKNHFLSWLADYKVNQTYQQAHRKFITQHKDCSCTRSVSYKKPLA